MTAVIFPDSVSYLDGKKISDFISRALIEDVGPGDYSTLASVEDDATGSAEIVLKANGILAGVTVALEVFRQIDSNLDIEVHQKDGASVFAGDLVMTLKGRAQAILTAERLALNMLQRMSGIATKTAELSELIAHTSCKLIDTRKTTPNFRMFEKWAVLIGGGQNHRFALYDMVMLKDNHIDYSGGITRAVMRTKEYLAANELNLKIEVETRNLKEVKEAAEAGVDVILLDNMAAEELRQAVVLVDGRSKTEASGGISEQTIVDYAETGVDYISVGALTHSYKSLDMSLKARINL